MELDIRTLLFMTTFYSFFIGSFTLFYPQKNINIFGFRTIGTGILISGIGYILFSFAGVVHDFIGIVIANCLIIGGTVILHYGLRKFYNKPSNLFWADVLAMIFLFFAYIYLTLISANVSMRIIMVSIYEMVYFGRNIGVALKGNEKTRPNLIIAIYFFILEIYLVMRMIDTLTSPEIITFMDTGFLQALSIIEYQIMPFILVLGLFWESNNRMEKSLQYLATTDPLTELNNRRSFMEAADGMKCNESAYEKKCCILLIDIDYFKKINDTYGHPVGDIVLKKISRIMKAEVESIDIFARFGGEEFSVILVDSTLESAIETAERIREVVEKNDN